MPLPHPPGPFRLGRGCQWAPGRGLAPLPGVTTESGGMAEGAAGTARALLFLSHQSATLECGVLCLHSREPNARNTLCGCDQRPRAAGFRTPLRKGGGVHAEAWRDETGLLRDVGVHCRRHRAREATEALASHLENTGNRGVQSRLEGSLRRSQSVTPALGTVVPLPHPPGLFRLGRGCQWAPGRGLAPLPGVTVEGG